MRWDEIGEIRCSVARALGVVGDRWTLLVIRDLFLGLRRFDRLQRSLGVTRHVLAERLEKLVEQGVVERVPYQHKPMRHEYRLTEKGIDLYPVLLALIRWGDRWEADAAGPPVLYRHKGCGAIAMPTLHCPACGEPVAARDIQPQAQPGAGTRQRGQARGGARSD